MRYPRVYVERLNTALRDYPELHGQTIENLLRRLEEAPPAIRSAPGNNGDGHLNQAERAAHMRRVATRGLPEASAEAR